MRIDIKTVSIFAAVLFLLFSCDRRSSGTMQVLSHADSLMEDYPDSAYAIISALGSDRFDTDEEEAYYSLLMSMAMDKQNIALSNHEANLGIYLKGIASELDKN